MAQQLQTTSREAVLVEDAELIRMMGIGVLEAVPSRGAPYELTDPFILVHEGRFRPSELAGKNTRHPHRGFDNIWYVLQGSASTGHSTGPDGSTERVSLGEGSLLFLRTGRGVWHAEAVGEEEVEEGHGEAEFRSVLFWVNLARKDKHVEPTALVVPAGEIRTRREGDATVRTLVGEGSPVQLGTPALILDVELPEGGQVTIPVPSDFQGFAYVLDGEAGFGANARRARPPQLVLLGPGQQLAVTDAAPGTRFMVMTGKPYGEVPAFNGPFVD
jgi:redox-sensitive bicupin YhaK (pirin superfamily)